jgi:hypothetical protein
MWIAMIKNLGTNEHLVMVDTNEGSEERRYIGTMMNEMEFDVRAKAGSMLPENREWIENKIMQLMQMGLITDPLYILENVELPGKEKLIRNLMEQQAGPEPMSEEEMSALGTDEDEVLRKLQEDPQLMNRIPTDEAG